MEILSLRMLNNMAIVQRFALWYIYIKEESIGDSPLECTKYLNNQCLDFHQTKIVVVIICREMAIDIVLLRPRYVRII